MKGAGLVSQDATQLRSSSPAREFDLAIYALTAQTDSASAWLTELERVIETAGQIQRRELAGTSGLVERFLGPELDSRHRFTSDPIEARAVLHPNSRSARCRTGDGCRKATPSSGS